MKKAFLLYLTIIIGLSITAQSIRGPDRISYFQAPAEGVKFNAADVYLLYDQDLQNAKIEQAKNDPMAMGSSFQIGGSIGEMIDRIANAMKGEVDNDGKFDTWNFVPPYIIAKAETNKNVIVEIFYLNETDPSPSMASMNEPKADKNGYYDVPYYINCRYTVTTPRGNVVIDENLGVLSGTAKSLNPPPVGGKAGTVTFSDELSETEKFGINVAVNRVRQDVFARFGFGQFSAPIKLGVIKEIKASKKLIAPTLEIFENKRGLLLSNQEKEEVQAFVDIIENGIGNTSDKTRWVAYHNLSVCYAWLEEPTKAKEAYVKYGEEISETLDKFRRWNLLLQGKLPKEERKGLFIGGKDTKKFNNYRDIETFVNYYPEGAKRYEKLFFVINRDLKKFVDFYAHNDLLCQLYEIDFPYQFFPLNNFNGSPKSMKGTITKEGTEPIEMSLKFDKNRWIKELKTSQINILENGDKEKLISRDLQPIFNSESGRYIMMSDPNQRNVFLGDDKRSELKNIESPLTNATYCYVDNITKKGGFFGSKESSESVQLKVDLDGNIFFEGSSKYFKANAIFKDLLSTNGIEVKKTFTTSEFTTAANINKNGVMNYWSWNGKVTTDFTSDLSAVERNISASKMLREIEFIDTDEHGYPTQIKFNLEMVGKLDIQQKLSFKGFLAAYLVDLPSVKTEVTSSGFNLENSGVWDCEFKYDSEGNWIEMKIGPYSATRTFKY